MPFVVSYGNRNIRFSANAIWRIFLGPILLFTHLFVKLDINGNSVCTPTYVIGIYTKRATKVDTLIPQYMQRLMRLNKVTQGLKRHAI